MGRAKLALELIPKEKSRRLTFEKRKKGLMKKAHELSILCGVDTCVIIYPEQVLEPEVWPPEPEKVRRIIDRYRSEGPDKGSKRMTGLLDFFINRKKKLEGELKKVRTANWEAKFTVSDEIIVGLSENQLQSLLITLRGKLDVAKERLAAMKAAKLQEIAKSEMMFYDFYPKDNNQTYPDHLTSIPGNFSDDKLWSNFSNGGYEPQMPQPMPDPSAIMYNAFKLVPFGVHDKVHYPSGHNDMAVTVAAFNGFGDHTHSPLLENFQSSQLGSGSSVSFPEPNNFLSNMVFAENVGQCDAIRMQMQAQILPTSHQQMAPRIWFSGATGEQQTTVLQTPPLVPYPGLNELLIDKGGKDV